MFKDSKREGFISKLGEFFRYEFSMKGRSKYLGTYNFFNLFFAYSNSLDSYWDFIFRCVLGAKQELCINSKKGTTVQYVFFCSISTGHKELQVSFLRKNTFCFCINPGLSITINEMNWRSVIFFPVYIDASIWNSTYILCNHQKENLQRLKTSNEICLTKYNPLQLIWGTFKAEVRLR